MFNNTFVIWRKLPISIRNDVLPIAQRILNGVVRIYFYHSSPALCGQVALSIIKPPGGSVSEEPERT